MLYRCTVRFRDDNRSRNSVEVFVFEAESIMEASETVRQWFPLLSKDGHQGFRIEEASQNGVRSPRSR